MTKQRWFAIHIDGEKREIKVMGPYYGPKEQAHKEVIKKTKIKYFKLLDMTKGISLDKMRLEYKSLHKWVKELGYDHNEATEIVSHSIKAIEKGLKIV